MPRKIISVIEGVVKLRQQEHADDDNEETYCLHNVGQDTDVDSKSVAIDIKSHASAVTDFTEQLNIARTGRQRGQGNED